MASKGVIQNRLSQPLGSKYLSATDHTEVNCTEFVAQEDTIITLLEGGDASVAATDVDYKSSMNLDGVTLKKGALIVSPAGEAFQNINISEGSALAYNSVFKGEKPGSFVGLLDLYPNASVAYSLRKLRADYAGPAIEVRKTVAGDTFVQDIGFVDNELDTTSLLSFAGSDDVFVSTWYDQSGGDSNNAVQISQSSQPQIVNNGVLNTNNGLPSIYFDGVDDTLIFTEVNVYSAFLVENVNIIGGYGIIGNSTNSNIIGDLNSSSARIRLNGTNYDYSVANSDNALTTLNRSVNDYSLFINGVASSNNPRTIANDMNLNAMMNRENLFFYEGNLQEVILFEADQSANLSFISTNINDYYSIYE